MPSRRSGELPRAADSDWYTHDRRLPAFYEDVAVTIAARGEVTANEVADVTGYTAATLINPIRKLFQREILEAEGTRGNPYRYRLTPHGQGLLLGHIQDKSARIENALEAVGKAPEFSASVKPAEYPLYPYAKLAVHEEVAIVMLGMGTDEALTSSIQETTGFTEGRSRRSMEVLHENGLLDLRRERVTGSGDHVDFYSMPVPMADITSIHLVHKLVAFSQAT